jgi:O-methyltransferase
MSLGLARRAFRGVQFVGERFGVEMRRVGHVPSGIPDAELYRPYFEPWRSAAFRTLLRHDDLHSHVTLDRKYVLYVTLDQALRRCGGDVAECGVYRGGTAYILAARVESAKRTLHLFDTFAGMPPTDPARDLHRENDFQGTSLDAVEDYLSPFSCVAYHPGRIPGTLDAVAADRFCFVHIDLDIYDAIKTATEFFYSRLAPGGAIVYDDYGLPSCPGARAAVDEFFADKPETALVLAGGQSLVLKL